ncbi:ATP-binding cassette domain-containing protein [Segatella oulorum]|uniref:ATP-binding cassette domain-containing protein n=1 Tax=Segatella oulorum TaxID=28136 RepID=UPI0028EEA77C|nr:ATP-binding cassette domain-containing protein [Segatella oulorum]
MNVDRITFQSVVPQVFESQKEALHSEVWNRELTFEKGKLYLIEAASGRGKSTFCSYVLGYRHDYSGQVLFNDVPTSTFKVRDWVEARRLHISHLFQELRLFPELTAFENIVIKNKLTNFKSQEQIATWFEQLGIADKMHERIGRMSFGQQQRVALIRALVQPFDFLLVDEPISHLDDKNAAVMAEMMMKEAREQGAGVLVTSIGKHMDLPYERVVKL